MATQLNSVQVSAPGFFGLNKEQSGSLLEPQWATEAMNCVMDRFGRIASRKGWVRRTSVGMEVDGPVRQIFEYVDEVGTSRIIFTTDTKIYFNPVNPVDITGTLTPTAGDWKFQNFNGYVVGWQEEHNPIIWEPTESAFKELSPTAGPIPLGNECLAATGRIWAFDATHTVLHYSDLLIPGQWYDGESDNGAGFIDLKSVWAYGMDQGTALAMFNGHLIIFGKNSILIYENPGDPMNMSLVENIRGVGCIARDSVQNVGNDILFLSSSGVRSLSRVVQEKSLPLGDTTKNVRNYLSDLLSNTTIKYIKSVYSEKEGFYLLTIPERDRVICIDIRSNLPDGSKRITEWSGITPHSFVCTQDQVIYIGKDGVVGEYATYADDGKTYPLTYYSGWTTVTNESRYLLMKHLDAVIYSGSNTTVEFKWAFNYVNRYYTVTKTLSPGGTAEYGIAEYGQAEFSGGNSLNYPTIPGMGHGRYIKFGIETRVAGSEVSLQQLGIKVKVGRLY